jgi:cell division septation protein DedD
MRHYKPDVSHRMKRRPSIFTAAWFRVVLGLGVVVILALVVGPSVSGWLRGERRPAPTAARPGPADGTRSEAERGEPGAAVALRAEATPAAPMATNGATATRPAKAAAGPDLPAAVATPAPSASTVPAEKTPASRGPAIYRIQVGAFLDHRNADRLIERLRGEGVEAANSLAEESRMLYRVVATPPDGDGYAGLAERLRALGLEPEAAEDGAAVTRPVPLTAAVETSRRLREQGVRVRLQRQASSAAFRVVRVGAYDTAEDAERARTDLAKRGYEGFVVREAK